MSQFYTGNTGGAGGAIETIAGDTGSITGANVTIYANNASNNCGQTVEFVNSGTVSTLNLTDSNDDTFLGRGAGGVGVSGNSVAIGLNAAGNGGLSNSVAIGNFTLLDAVSVDVSVAIGLSALSMATTGDANIAIGRNALGNLLTGSDNIAIGDGAGTGLTGAEEDNIYLGEVGIAGESHVLRVGRPFGGGAGQNLNYTAGITGATPVDANTPQVVLCDSDGNLTVTSSSTAGFVLTSNGTAAPTFQAAGGGGTSPLFQAYLSANQSNVTGDGTTYTIPFDTVSVNTGSAFNTGTGVFTAPANGTYLFTGTVYLVEGGAFVGMTQCSINLVTTSTTFILYTVNPATINGNASLVLPISAIVPMSSTDTAYITVQVVGGTKTVLVGGLQGLSAFAGFKIS